jgi:hypothetical protein
MVDLVLFLAPGRGQQGTSSTVSSLARALSFMLGHQGLGQPTFALTLRPFVAQENQSRGLSARVD